MSLFSVNVERLFEGGIDVANLVRASDDTPDGCGSRRLGSIPSTSPVRVPASNSQSGVACIAGVLSRVLRRSGFGGVTLRVVGCCSPYALAHICGESWGKNADTVEKYSGVFTRLECAPQQREAYAAARTHSPPSQSWRSPPTPGAVAETLVDADADNRHLRALNRRGILVHATTADHDEFLV